MTGTARRIVERIVDDISDRAGLGHIWESLDDVTQFEIEEKWGRIIDEERA